MDSELKKKWVDKLRSGEYNQGNHQLRSKDDCFCCLGVLCDIIDPESWQESDVGSFLEKSHGFSYTTFPTTGFLNDIGLDRGIALELADMNDNDTSFAEIADFIENTKDI